MSQFLFGWRRQKNWSAAGSVSHSSRSAAATNQSSEEGRASLEALIVEHRQVTELVNALRQSGSDAEWQKAFTQQSQLLAQILALELGDDAKVQERDRYLDEFCREIGLRDRTELRKYRPTRDSDLPS